jgi:hypothetical protein
VLSLFPRLQRSPPDGACIGRAANFPTADRWRVQWRHAVTVPWAHKITRCQENAAPSERTRRSRHALPPRGCGRQPRCQLPASSGRSACIAQGPDRWAGRAAKARDPQERPRSDGTTTCRSDPATRDVSLVAVPSDWHLAVSCRTARSRTEQVKYVICTMAATTLLDGVRGSCVKLTAASADIGRTLHTDEFTDKETVTFVRLRPNAYRAPKHSSAPISRELGRQRRALSHVPHPRKSKATSQ